MPQIKNIERNISQLQAFIDEYAKLLRDDPDNFAHKVALSGLEGQLIEVQQQLYTENLKREKEIVQLRFLGSHVIHGSFPLQDVGALLIPFQKQFFKLQNIFNTGRKLAKTLTKL